MTEPRYSPAPLPATPPERSHAQLLDAIARDQDREAFAELFEHFAPRIKSFLMKGGLDEAPADELAQETMLTVWQKAGSYNPAKAAASTWIFTIARNKKIDAFRRMKADEIYPEDLTAIPDQSAGPDTITNRSEETTIIASALKDLPEDQAALLKKSFFEDKSHAEIAEETGIPLGTIKSRIRLALEKLRGKQEIKALW